jgi:transposase
MFPSCAWLSSSLTRVERFKPTVQRYFPVLLPLCSAADEPWLWSLLQCAPLPTQAAKLTLRRLEKLLGQYRIRRFSSEDLAVLLRQPPLPMAPGSTEALAESALLLLPQLFLLHKQLTTLAKRLEKIIDQLQHDTTFPEHRDIAILRSFPGVGRGFTAKVLAEAFTPLVDRDYHAFRALSGVAPVTRQSGKSKLVSQRHACNHRVQHAVFHSANIFVQKDPQARQQYHELRRKGNTHARALRGVADRMLALIFALLKNQCFYDPTRRNGVTVPEVPLL